MPAAKGRIIKKPTRNPAVEYKAKQLSSPKQRKMLVDFLERHPNIATCSFRTDGSQRDIVRRLWYDLAIVLNKLDGAHHSADHWRRIWRDMKHKVKSKMAHNASRKRKKIYKFSVDEERVAKILLYKFDQCDEESQEKTIIIEDDSEEPSEDQYIDNSPNELEIDTDPNENDDYVDVYEQCLSLSQSHQQIGISDTQEESQMSISKSLQDICQQNAEILQHVRQTYYLMAEDSKRKQEYRSTKMVIYKRELELLQSKLEMDKLKIFSNI